MQSILTKEYGAFYCTFRNYKATDKTSLMRGYRLWFKFEFSKDDSEINPFSNFDFIKEYLIEAFDWTSAVSSDDPHIQLFYDMDDAEVIDIRIMKNVGLGAFVRMVYTDIASIISSNSQNTVQLIGVSVRDEDDNSAELVSPNV